MRVAVVSHGKDEGFFFPMWCNYYGNLFGLENLFFVKDESDWDISSRSSSINLVNEKFPEDRRKFDQAIGVYMSKFCSQLLTDYDVVLRCDVDEFVFVDPNKGDWEAALNEVVDVGYMYVLGFDVLHQLEKEGNFDTRRSVFEQRKLLRLDGTYCKSHLIAEPTTWIGPCHKIPGKLFQMSNYLCMAHLALIDKNMFIDRVEARGDMSKNSRRNHAQSRLNKIFRFSNLTPYNSYALFDGLRDGVVDMTRKKGSNRVLMPWSCLGYPRNIPKGFLIERPEHFMGIL